MRAASTQDTILFNDTPVMLLPDLSHQTLTMRKEWKPLTQLLQTRQIKYQWRFPFHLPVHHDSKTAIFSTLGDLPSFLSTLEIPQVSLPDWPFTLTTPGLPFAPQWQEAGTQTKLQTLITHGPQRLICTWKPFLVVFLLQGLSMYLPRDLLVLASEAWPPCKLQVCLFAVTSDYTFLLNVHLLWKNRMCFFKFFPSRLP